MRENCGSEVTLKFKWKQYGDHYKTGVICTLDNKELTKALGKLGNIVVKHL
jgi:hypothetical protein